MVQENSGNDKPIDSPEKKGYLSLVSRKIVQMKKGSLELAILALLSLDECYGYDLCQQLKQNGVETVAGTVYPLLNRLKKEGIIDYTWKESVQGPPRKYYVLTALGRDVFREMCREWDNLKEGLQNIIAKTEL